MGVEADYAPMDLGGGKKAITDADSAAFPPKSAACGVPIGGQGREPGLGHERIPKKKGSSRISGKRCLDFEEEVIGVAVAEGLSLDQLDLVVDALELAGMHGPAHA